jgi:hypothetical protein
MALGGTVQEVKQRMSYAEAQLWFEYRRKHGGIGEARTAYLLACLNVMTNNSNGGKAGLHDFLPGIPAPEPEIIDDAEKMMQFWVG